MKAAFYVRCAECQEQHYVDEVEFLDLQAPPILWQADAQGRVQRARVLAGEHRQGGRGSGHRVLGVARGWHWAVFPERPESSQTDPQSQS